MSRRAPGPNSRPRWARVLALVLAVLLAVPALRTAWVLAAPAPSTGVARAQLRFLDGAVADGAGTRMQALFPEGFALLHALHADAWAGLAALTGRPADAEAARARCLAAVAALAGPEGTAPFEGVADPPRGVFWSGWSLLLRADAARLVRDVPAPERAELAVAVDEVAGAFERSPVPFLPSYRGQAWPVDSVVALAALRRAAPLVGAVPRVDRVVRRWLASVDAAALPHSVDGSGRVAGPRGTSQALLLPLLREVDADAADRAWSAFRAAHVRRVLGFPAVREHPPGQGGGGDVDSGPLVLGVSLSATAVAVGAARSGGDPGLAAALDDAAEVVGAPLPLPGGRRYAAGVLPVADALLVWARTRPVGEASGPGWDRAPLWALWTLLPLGGSVLLVRRARRS